MQTPVPIPGFADPLSSWTHLVGAAVFLVLGVRLMRRHRAHGGHVAALLVLCVSSVLLLSLSGVYHLLERGGAARPVLRQLDHAAIFVLIAGSLTTVHGLLFAGRMRWLIITLAWCVCAAGVTLKLVFFAQTPEWLGLTAYFGMGLIGLVSTLSLWWLHGLAFVGLWLGGGLTYTAGALVDFLRLPVIVPGVLGPHELLHVAVLVALGLHWRFVTRVIERENATLRA
ncbi:MAG: hypothetical protein DHS20C15_26970 [Planctomycetota bacterium]|nr:MAG: hypothetical protein DHS20C15_26970 [Planctomycetota bacterium]